MASGDRASGGWVRQVRRLFGLGTVGGLMDGELLDRFVCRRGEDSEAAFEELMHRHGPMVLRVCRGVLRNPQDAEDALQATFLVLANRAGSIRRKDSVASWLFGVSQRVAAQARLRASRRHAGERVVAERTPEAYLAADSREEQEALLEEVDRLPDRLRAVVVLCYLEGLTYDVAAQRLCLSEGSVRGRLARARERLCRRLTGRGVTVPAGLLVAGTAVQSHAQTALSVHVPASLVDSTVRTVLGFKADETAAALAQGVLKTMLLSKLKMAGIVLFAMMGSSLLTWYTFAARNDDKVQQPPNPVPHRALFTPKPESAPKPEPQADASKPKYAMTGSVRVEGTGEPVKGGKFDVLLGDSAQDHHGQALTVRSGDDGRFVVDLPPGQARSWTFFPPVGYWAPDNGKSQETFVVAPDRPIHHKDYLVRHGVIWTFQLTIGAEGRPGRGGTVAASTQNELFMAAADDAGLARLTLPSEGLKLTVNVAPEPARVDSVTFQLEWNPHFRPEAVKTVDHREGRSLLTDEDGKTATITTSTPVEPAITNGKLALRVSLREPDLKSHGSIIGRVIDSEGRPIAGARVTLGSGDPSVGSAMSWSTAHQVATDAQGNYVIHLIPRREPKEKPEKLFVVVTKEGYAGLDSPWTTFQPGADGSPQVLDPIRLAPGVSLSGAEKMVLEERLTDITAS